MIISSEQITRKFRLVYKTLLYFICVLLFLLINFLIGLIVPGRKNKLFLSTKVTTFIVKITLLILGVNVRVKDENRFRRGKNFLAVSNHVSYIDVYSIASIMNSVFVASVDGVEKDFIMGTATRLSGGIFVDRQNRSRIKRDMNAIKEVLDLGYNVVLFPEAATSNGDRVLPFRSSLFASAINAGADVVTISINYLDLNGDPVSKANRDNIFYYEHLEFFPHFFNLLQQKSITLEIDFMSKIEYDPNRSRKELCNMAYIEISGAFKKM
jgi:1-acyl-sn-glycerol-3-phosphate acyltransferase